MNNNLVYYLKDSAIILKKAGIIESNPSTVTFDEFSYAPIEVITASAILQNDKNIDFKVCNACEREQNIVFSELDFTDGNTLYLFFAVDCDKDKDCIMLLPGGTTFRFWINTHIFFFKEGRHGQLTTFHINKGRNCFCFELTKANHNMTFFAHINSLEAEEVAEASLVTSCSNRAAPVSMLLQREYASLKYVLYNNDKIGFKGNVSINIKAEPSSTVIYSSTAKINNKYIVSLDALDARGASFLNVELSCMLDTGKSYSRVQPIPTKRNDDYFEEIKELTKGLSKKELSGYDKLAIEYWMNKISINSSFDTYATCLDCFYKIQNGSLFESVYSEGNHKVYLRSALDGKVVSYIVRIPKNYDKYNKYPFLALCSIKDEDDFCTKIQYTEDVEDFLCADVSGRGMTLGSYIGDASINEIIEHIKATFSVDENRVYISGHSAGSYAAWAQAQLYPDRYAGLLTSTGAPNWDLIGNLYNLPTHSFWSSIDMDKEPYFEKKVKNGLDGLPEYTSYMAEKHLHNSVEYLNKPPKVLNELFSHARVEYPSEIYFSVTRHRAKKAYWIELHEIKKGCIEAKIYATAEKSKISVKTQNATGVYITIPPFVDKNNFEVAIDGQVFSYENEINQVLYYIIQEDEKFERVAAPPHITYIYKGNGLLDVYLSPMKVIIPNSCEEIIRRTALNFSSPTTNGVNRGLSVNYPIIELGVNEQIEKHLQNAAVILDSNSEIDTFSKWRQTCPIKTNNDGFSYNVETYKGKYLVMQIMQNPYNADASILYINTNDVQLYRKNMFTRQVILSCYANGFHPFYNNSVLIFYDRGYYRIPDYGMDIKEIK